MPCLRRRRGTSASHGPADVAHARGVVRLRPVTESRSARLADIAAQADVSEATVSRVLNDRPGVSEPTRQAVLTAIDVLGYDRPTRLQAEVGAARRPGDARAGQPDLPGVRAGHRDRAGRRGLHAGAVHADPGRGARGRLRADAARPRRRPGSSSCPASTPTPPPTRRRYQCAARARPADRAGQRLAGRASTPRSCPTTTSRRWTWPSTTSSQLGPHRDRAGPRARSATRRCIRKVQGFRAAMREHLGVEPAHLERLVTHTVFSLEGGAAAAGRLISRGATAVICGSDLMALGAIRQARSMGLRVPARRLGGRLRRLDDDGVHRPAADHDPPVGRGDGGRRGAGPARRDRRRGPARGRSTSSGPSSSCAARPARCRSAPEPRAERGCRVAGIRGDLTYRLVGAPTATSTRR